MRRQFLQQLFYHLFVRVITPIERYCKCCLQPVIVHPTLGAVMDITRSKSELIAENAFLRQQLVILRRQTKRPTLTPLDRGLLVMLAGRLRTWREALLIVKPDTLLIWHRQGFRIFWRHKSNVKQRPPRIAPELIVLIHSMALENRLWGTKRIQDELRKLGFPLAKRTVSRYIRQVRPTHPPRKSTQTWGTFLKNHAHEIWACDFLQTYDLWFRSVFVFFIIELGSRRVMHFAVTSSPTDVWVAQQLREATPFDTRPRFLIRDNDRKFGTEFARAARGINVLHTPIHAPKANAVCERFLGSIRRECLDHVLILNERQLHRILKEYVHYFNTARPHQALDGQIPLSMDLPSTGNNITAFPVLNGLHHDYRRSA
ncbi:MAG: integrase core domain-containing protein [Chloroflexota bacterium]